MDKSKAEEELEDLLLIFKEMELGGFTVKRELLVRRKDGEFEGGWYVQSPGKYPLCPPIWIEYDCPQRKWTVSWWEIDGDGHHRVTEGQGFEAAVRILRDWAKQVMR